MPAAVLVSPLVGAAVAALRSTLRVTVLHPEHERELKKRGVPFVYALWHGRMVLPILTHRHQGIVTMASRSRDGEIIARWLVRNGVHPARGSTRKGGRAALEEMIDEVRRGRPAALTVDGPKGPPRAVQTGLVYLARQTGAWILPHTGSCSNPWFLRSWDGYLVPKPFSRCVIAYGEPFPVTDAMTDAEVRSRTAGALDAITLEADREAGINPPPPWEDSGAGPRRP